MTVEYIRYDIPPRRADGFCTAYAAATAILHADPRCLSYEVSQSPAGPENFLVRIEWGAGRTLQGSRADPAFVDFFALVDPFADYLIETRSYEVVLISPDVPEKGLPTLYEWAGGRLGIGRFIYAFYDRV